MTSRARLATIGSILFVSLFIGGCGSGPGGLATGPSTDGGSSSGGNTPTIIDFSPRSGSAGLPVTITGTHFGVSRGSGARDGGTSSVTFNGTDAGSSDYVQWSDTQVVVNVPTGATQGKITVTTPAGSASTDSDFTVAKKIVAGGDFTRFDSATRWGIARVNADGTIDKTFNPGAGADKTVYCVARQSDGKILIGGDFQHYNGTAVNRIARLNPDGSLDTSFLSGTGPDQAVYSILAESNGKLLIGGAFTSYNGTARNKMARLNADGTLDTTLFNLATISMVRCIVKQADGKILVGGDITGNIARLETDGTVDPAFTSPMYFEGTVYALAVQGDGKILVGCGPLRLFHAASVTILGVFRLDSNGGWDFAFPGGAGGTVSSIKPQADGKVVIGGYFGSANGVTRNHLARLNADGTLDAGLDPGTGPSGPLQALEIQGDGKVFCGGTFETYAGVSRNGIARASSNGALDATFAPGLGVDGTVYATCLQADGKLLIAGDFHAYGGSTQNRVARLHSDGTRDASFEVGDGFDPGVRYVATQSDGKVLAGGSFTRYRGTLRNGMARINADGTLDATFDPGTGLDNSGRVDCIAVQPDGKVLMGGTFSQYNGAAAGRLTRLNPDGSRDTTFNAGGSGVGGFVQQIAVQGDGSILVAGSITTYDGAACNGGIIRLQADGTIDSTFNGGATTGADGGVQTVTVQSDGKILIGGDFSNYNAVGRAHLARLNSNGTLDTTFTVGTGSSGTVYSIAVLAEGKILIGGSVDHYNGVPQGNISRVNADGTLDATFNAGGVGATWEIYSIVPVEDGKILIGGVFVTYNGVTQSHLGRLNADGSLDTTFYQGGVNGDINCLTSSGLR